MKKLGLYVLTLLLVACVSEDKDEKEPTDNGLRATLVELSDEDYPDNPDISIRHQKCVSTEMEAIEFRENNKAFDLIIYPTSKDDDTVVMKGIQLMEFMPSIPEYAKKDEYMSLISVVNQEWNRNQVKWEGEELIKVIPNEYVVNGEKITRIDVARNCLNSYLWELFFYTDVDGKNQVFYHGWFDFPKGLYKELFEQRNGEDFEVYAAYLEYWKDPANQSLNLERIRELVSTDAVSFVNHDEEMYPLEGERKKKVVDIIYPAKFSKMSDFHTDSSLFATFSQPGFYNRSDPRKTELGRFQQIEEIEYRKTKSANKEYDELKLEFTRDNGERTQFIFGGLNFSHLPQLSAEKANSGKAFSMGIGNHPFYEDNLKHEQLCSKESPYFAVLLDGEGRWLDSHKIGIDGPLLHLDEKNPKIIHVWLLSFERQALVGHYEIDLSKTTFD